MLAPSVRYWDGVRQDKAERDPTAEPGEHPLLWGCGWEDEDGALIVGFNGPLSPPCAPISHAALCSLGLELPGKGMRDVGEAGLLVCVQSPARGFTHLV